MPELVAITGGIGSGKSIVSRILSCMGLPVYDCDSRARLLMDGSPDIKARIALEICSEAIGADGAIDRRRLASEVFSDKGKLEQLNGIVHGAVRDDIIRWARSVGAPVCWIESAIIYESGIDRMVDEVWEVEAPVEVRIARVMSRNAAAREDIEARIASQIRPAGISLHRNTKILINDGTTALLPQIIKSLDDLKTIIKR